MPRHCTVSFFNGQGFSIALVCAGMSISPACAAGSASDALRTRYDELQNHIRDNQFRRPLHLDSKETENGVSGDVHALINHPFTRVTAALSSPHDWCNILMMHPNTKHCQAKTADRGNILSVSIGKKYDQPLKQAYRVDFGHRVAAHAADYLQVRLEAEAGPLSTRNYRIALEAIPLDNGRTFIHLSYTYAYGMAGRLAMQAYLGTIGRDKVGFTVIGTRDGLPRHIGGIRGVVERNTMRYYLAIDTYLDALTTPSNARLEKRLQDWFTASERYPRQLHEMERDAYLDMKRREHQRQQTELPAARAG